MRSLTRTVYSCLSTAFLLTALPAHAALITYTDPVAWNAAANGITTIGFEGLAPANSFKDYKTSTGLTISGVQFIGYESFALGQYDLAVWDSGLASPYYNFNSGASLASPSYNSPPAGSVPYVHVILPANVTALGVDLMTVSPNALIYQVSVPGSSYNVATASRPTRTFFGLTSDTAIPYVDFAVTGTTVSGGTYGLIDNVKFGAADASQTAEASTLLLIGSGLLAIRLLRRKRTTPNGSPCPASA